MRLVPFLIFDAIGAAVITGLVAGLGYGIGRHAVDVVLLIDEYALWITLALVALVSGIGRGALGGRDAPLPEDPCRGPLPDGRDPGRHRRSAACAGRVRPTRPDPSALPRTAPTYAQVLSAVGAVDESAGRGLRGDGPAVTQARTPG
jgi:hypothetical protein